MDSSVSSSSLSSAPNAVAATGVASEEDVSLLSVTQTLAKDARVLFQLGKYADCLKVLHRLLQKKSDDPKILHNIAIAENFQDGFSNPKRFLEVLHNLKKRSERLAHSSGEHQEGVNNNGNKSTGNKGPNNVAILASPTNSSASIFLEDFVASVIMFNIAATWYHLHEYEKCFSILEPLYQNIEPIDERVARHICLLLLDGALVCRHASRAADVINYLERIGGNSLGSQGDSGSFTQQQSTNLMTKSSSMPSNVIVPDAISNSDATSNANGPESPISRTLSEETLYESLMSTLDISGQNLTRPSNDLPRTQVDESPITPDLRLKLHLYKVWLLLLTRNIKAAKREVKMAMNVARGKDYSLALFLKSQLEYARGNHRKAIKLLMASNNQGETGISSMYYNNLGCIYYQLGKYHTSTVFFSKALSSSSPLRKEKPLKLLSFSQDKSLLIVYNCGLVYLASGKPALAAHCFQKAGLIFYNRPLLWLRIAECCLMALEKKSEIKVNVIGRGKWRQLVIGNGNPRNGQVEFVGRAKENLSSGDDRQQQPNLSLPFAQRCLSNALHLLDHSESKSDSPPDLGLEDIESRDMVIPSKSSNSKASSNPAVGPGQVNSNGEVKEQQKVGNSLNASLQSSVNEYEHFCVKQDQMIKQAVLADLAYVQLELGNPLKALSTARSLLRLPECSNIYLFLGHLYAAEALSLLNRPKEASDHLSRYVSGESVELPYTQEDCEKWQTEKVLDFEEPGGDASLTAAMADESSQGLAILKPEEARGTLLTNLAAMSAVHGDMDRAHQLVALALSLVPNNPETVLTAIYVDLVRGNAQEAIVKLKQCSRVRFLPPSSLTLNRSS